MALNFHQLSQQEQANAALPTHVFPITAVGRAPDTLDNIVSARVVQSKKEVHRIPANSGLIRSMSMWWPMFTGSLPVTSLATLKKGYPALGTNTYAELVSWLISEYSVWDEEKRILFQAEVADEAPDPEVGRYVATMLMGVSLVNGGCVSCILGSTFPSVVLWEGLGVVLCCFFVSNVDLLSDMG